jgi:hypothetical protein
MSITLDDFDVDPQTKPVLRVALEMTRVASHRRSGLRSPAFASSMICAAMMPSASSSVTPSVRRIEQFARAFVRRLTGDDPSAPTRRRTGD